jgi:succinate dehydrogenase/fumarate reductase flavoprotein subunit
MREGLRLDTDILIIGSGGAGLVAACEARRRGARVLLVTKATAGMANCTAYAGGGFTGPYGAVTKEEHRLKTLEIGRGINIPHMLAALADSREKVPALQEFGVKMDIRDGGVSVAKYGLTPITGGTGMTLPLVAHAKSIGVDILENTMVTGVFTQGSRVTGVRALDTRSGKLSSIAAKAVIVATGGAGRLYSRTDNPARTTGDGFALLAELGLPFIDMEFVQFYPMGFAEPGFPMWMIGLDFADLAPVTDENGKEFLKERWTEWGIKNGREANAYTRDRSSQAIAKEWVRGGEVLVHVEKVTPDDWKRNRGQAVIKMFPKGRVPADGPIRVKPLEHYFPGGTLIGPDCSTEIKGLFASGEVTGGTDGANRIGGNALSMITVFGFRAAESALAHAAGVAIAELPDAHPADRSAREWLANESGFTPAEVKKRVNDTADENLAVVRSEQGIKTAIAALHEIAADTGRMVARTGSDLMNAYEAQNIITVGKLVAQAALLRTESRGVHYRSDFPVEDENWKKHIEIRLSGGTMKVETIPVNYKHQ